MIQSGFLFTNIINAKDTVCLLPLHGLFSYGVILIFGEEDGRVIYFIPENTLVSADSENKFVKSVIVHNVLNF